MKQQVEGAALKEIEAVMRWSRGAEYWQIAEDLGYTNASGAWKAVQRGLSHFGYEAVNELRQAQGIRLRRIIARGMNKAVPDTENEFDTGAAKVVLRAIELEARIFGTLAPTKIEAEVVTKDALVEELEELTREIAALDADRSRRRTPRSPRE